MTYQRLSLPGGILIFNYPRDNMYLMHLLFILILFPLLAWSDCEQIYLDRLDMAEVQFADMDISDEYTLAKPKLIRHPYIYGNLEKMTPRLKFSLEKKENKDVRKDLLNKIKNKKVKVSKITNLMYQSRVAYLVKEKLNNQAYYSFIFYLDLNCSPFTSVVSAIKSPELDPVPASAVEKPKTPAPLIRKSRNKKM